VIIMNNIEVKLLRVLQAATKPLTTTELSTAAGFPRTTAKDYVKRLAEADIIKDVGHGGQHGWLLGESVPDLEEEDDVMAKEAFFVKFFKEFYPGINPETNPDLAFVRLVGTFDNVYGGSPSSVPSSSVPLCCLTWFAIDYTALEGLDDDMHKLKEYVLEKAREQE
jgi:Winged helix-turn-helix DNA-binding